MTSLPIEDMVVDDDAVTAKDIKEWRREFNLASMRIEHIFYRPESKMHSKQYLRGLLKPIKRKNGWTIAREAGEKEPKATQRFLNLTPWDANELRDELIRYAMENLADPESIVAADPTGFAKKGRKSAGVQRQYSGTLGRIDNCQIGTFLAYVTPDRERILFDRELYIPEKTWFGDPERCAEAGIPEHLTFKTRPAQVIAMLERTLKADVPFAWFTADEEFGQNPDLRTYLEKNTIPYVMAIKKTTEITDTNRQKTVFEDIPPRLNRNTWQRRACGIGSKGFRTYDWALINSDHPDHQYMIRRSLDDGELAFYHCYNPHHKGFGELVRVAGARWPIEECFETGKGEVGLADYQVRLYHAWYRHITLAMYAHTFLTIIRHRRKAKKGIHRLWTKNPEPQDQHSRKPKIPPH